MPCESVCGMKMMMIWNKWKNGPWSEMKWMWFTYSICSALMHTMHLCTKKESANRSSAYTTAISHHTPSTTTTTTYDAIILNTMHLVAFRQCVKRYFWESTQYLHWIRNEIRCTFVSMKCLMHFSATLEKHWMKKILERIGFFFFFSLCGRFTTDIVRFFSLRWMDVCDARHCRRFTMVAC